MRYQTKEELVRDMEEQFEALLRRLEGIPRARYAEPGVWGDDWTINDLLAHLVAWHRLFLGWHRDGLEGREPELPAPGYRWNQTPALNRDLQREHRDRPTDELQAELEASHAEVLQLARRSSAAELFTPGRFPWTGKNALVTYLGANTASHYRFACKVLRRWARRDPATADGGADDSPRLRRS